MQEWPVVAATFHEEKFNQNVFVLLKAVRKNQNFSLKIVEKEAKKLPYFFRNKFKIRFDVLENAFEHKTG